MFENLRRQRSVSELRDFNRTLNKLAGWKESLEIRLAASQEILDQGLPDMNFDLLEREVFDFAQSCRGVCRRLEEIREQDNTEA